MERGEFGGELDRFAAGTGEDVTLGGVEEVEQATRVGRRQSRSSGYIGRAARPWSRIACRNARSMSDSANSAKK